ncbi:MAG: sigma-70 family RNA polymerase sigma factor [Planctomycetes bacterium]|nr:sigma-70 family RNA polymerase sigma factor [Planctomycetota bacterium]
MCCVFAVVNCFTVNIEQLHAEYGRDLHRFLRVLVAQHAEADDFTQETFLQVLKHPFEQRTRGETAMYLRAIAKTAYLKHAQRKKRVVPVDVQTIEQDWAEAVGEEGDERVAALRRCITELTDRERQALNLRYVQNASREDMAAALGLSDGGVKNLLERIKARLKECVARQRH